ncbi:hypothetical protein [Fischerella thermalis]|uniref:hypothetical protein n=1 Tax=Fischerella thermalis TaxID=372787 RepID=UPI00307DB1F5
MGSEFTAQTLLQKEILEGEELRSRLVRYSRRDAFSQCLYLDFLWCLKLNVKFWLIYIVLYGGAIASSFLPTSRQAQSKGDRLVQEFTPSRPQPF